MERRPDLVRIDDFGVARPVDRGAVQRFKGAKGTYRLLPSPPRFVLLEKQAESGGSDALRLRLGGEISAPGMLCDVVSLIASAGWRGELLVWSTIGASDSAARSIFFETGNVLGAQSTASGERLGEIMYKLGALDKEQILAITKQTTPERRFGETAVDLGFVPRERLFELVRTQAEEIVYSALRCSEGTFWFVDGFDPARLAYQHRVSAQVLLMEGVRRMDEGSFFRERIPSPAHVPVPLPIRVEPPADLLSVFRACDGHRSVAEIGRACALPGFETTHALFRLAQGGFVKIESPRPNHPEGIVEIFNGAIRPIMNGADETRRGSQVRQRLAAFASGIGVYDALFIGAGPGIDGALDPSRIAQNLAPLAGDDPNTALSRWLHDYLSFALFDATTEMPKDRARRLNDEVSELVAQLAPKHGPSSVYPPANTANTANKVPEKPRPPPIPSRPRAEAPSPPPPQLPALQPLATPEPLPPPPPPPPVERPLPKATQMAIASTPEPPRLPAIFDDPTRDPMPAPMFAPEPVITPSRAPGRRRTVRTSLLVVAILLLAGAAAASLFVLGFVKLPTTAETEPTPAPTPTPTPKVKPRPAPTPEPEPTPSATAVIAAPPTSSAAPAPTTPPSDELPKTQGRLVLKAPAGFRVFVDNKVVGETPTPVVVACGLRTVKIGSHGSEQKITVPCGGEIDVYAK